MVLRRIHRLLALHTVLAVGLALSCSQSGTEVSPPASSDAGAADVTMVLDSFLVCGDQGEPCCEGFCNGSLACNSGFCTQFVEDASADSPGEGETPPHDAGDASPAETGSDGSSDAGSVDASDS
jgi:hypothetical protein